MPPKLVECKRCKYLYETYLLKRKTCAFCRWRNSMTDEVQIRLNKLGHT